MPLSGLLNENNHCFTIEELPIYTHFTESFYLEFQETKLMDSELLLEKRDRENGQKVENKEEGKVGKVVEEKCTGGKNYGLLLQTLTI